ncbi:MAG: glycosyltransferase [Nocardiopsaceae bacterium]|nr:glycosyltransferase [Nocardiopsaceae bacterium]
MTGVHDATIPDLDVRAVREHTAVPDETTPDIDARAVREHVPVPDATTPDIDARAVRDHMPVPDATTPDLPMGSATSVPVGPDSTLVDLDLRAIDEKAPTRDVPDHEVLSRPESPGRHRSTGASETRNAKFLSLELAYLSDGSVARFSGIGPVLARRVGPRPRLRPATFTEALSGWDQTAIVLMSGAWLASVYIFWSWWLEPAHRVGLFGLVANSVVLAYVSGFPVFFIAGVNRLRKVNPQVAVPTLRVAFVVTHAPSEPWPVVRRTLKAMLSQKYPRAYDVWLCSERPTEEITSWCTAHGVKVSTRSEEPEYHRDHWPRRTKCKEGNLTYFYDHAGYRSYDIVAQLDCDHVPRPGYLAEMVRPFADEAIGYVAAPSVCDANAAGSWAARGRLHKEATFHGPFQLGHSAGLAPLCIGSHYAVRTVALRQIGGIGPDLAEDFSTTFLLNAAGWHGAFAIDAEAHGDGPNTFPAMTVQEFQWSRSLTTILLGLVPRNLRRLPWRLRFRFLYALSYYSLLVSSTLAGLALAPVAAATGQPWINVNYLGFLAHWWSISIWLVLITALLRRRRLLRPRRAPLVSWENWLYSLTRWPFVALGIGAALLHLVWPRPVSFKVTPKEAGGLDPLPVRFVLPFTLISVLSAGAAIYGEYVKGAALGYVLLSIFGGVVYAMVALLLPIHHAHEVGRAAGISGLRALHRTAWPATILAVVACATAGTAIAFYPHYALQVLGL